MITTNPPNAFDRLARQKAREQELRDSELEEGDQIETNKYRKDAEDYLADVHNAKLERERRTQASVGVTPPPPPNIGAERFSEDSENQRLRARTAKTSENWDSLLGKSSVDVDTQRNWGIKPLLVNRQNPLERDIEASDTARQAPTSEMAQDAANNASERAENEPVARAINVPAPNKPGKYDMAFARWDSMMAEESRLERGIEDYIKKGPGAGYEEQKARVALTQQQSRVRQEFQKDSEDFDLQPAYRAWHDARFNAPPPNDNSASDDGPGMLQKFFTGAGNTAKYAVQHPKSALAHAYLGAKELTSLPLRGLEGLLDRDIPLIHARRNIEEHQRGLAESDEAEGIDPRSIGPVVAENIGQMVVPIPLGVGKAAKFFSKETAKNVGKGAAFGAGAYATERVANQEPIDEGIGTSAGIGGLLTGLLGRWMGRGGKASEHGTGGPTQPRQLEYTDPHTIYQGGPDSVGPLPQIGEGSSAIRQGGPLRQLEGPAPSVSKNATQLDVPQAWQNKIQALHREPNGEIIAQLPDGSFISAGIPASKMSTPHQPVQERGAIQRVLDTKRFNRDMDLKEAPGAAPPNAKGMVERVGAPEEAVQAQAGSDLAATPGSTPYPGSIYGMPGVKAPSAAVSEASVVPGKPIRAPGKIVSGIKPQAPATDNLLDTIMSKGRTNIPTPVAEVSPNVLPGWVPKEPGTPSPLAASVLEKAKARAQAMPHTPAAVDKAISVAESEAELGAILKGTKDMASVPVIRRSLKGVEPVSPKAVAPISPKGNEPQAVGASTKGFRDYQAAEDAWAQKALVDPNLSAVGKKRLAAYVAKVGPTYAQNPGGLKEIGAELTEPKVGDVTEVRIPDDRLHPEVRARMESAKAQVPKVEARIEAARARLAAQPSGNIAENKIEQLKAAALAKSTVAKENLADKKYKELRAAGIPDAKARDLATWKTDEKVTIPEEQLPTQRVEEFLKTEGYKVREKEPFPGEKSYEIVDPKTDNVIARGDREAITNAMEERAKAKGFKLASFPGDISGIKDIWNKAMQKAGVSDPEGVAIENAPARQSILNKVLQPFETPDFLMRHNPAGKSIIDSTSWGERMIGKRVNDLLYSAEGGTGSKPTKLFQYFEHTKADRAAIDKVLVYGDRVGVEYDKAQLMRMGLTEAQASGYEGVREALDKVRTWAKDSGEFLDAKEFIGYLPRVWHGNIEIFKDGTKFLQKDGSSAFETLQQASAQAYELKQANPASKIDLKFFADPEYLGGRAFQDAQVVSRLKRNLERMGSATAAEVDAAYKAGRDLRGFTKHLEQRKGETGYETEGLDKVLFNYFHQAAKMVEMRGVRTAAETVLKDHARDLSEGQLHYLRNYVERVAGRPTWDQAVISGLIKDTQIGKWLDPAHGSRAIQNVRGAVNHLTIGMGNIGFAISQVDSLIRHTWPALQREGGQQFGVVASEKFLLPAITQFFTDKAIRQRLAHYGIIDIQHMSEVRPQVGHTLGKGEWSASRVSMALGTATEEFTRGVTAIARYNMARAQGLDDMMALKKAAAFVDETQGRYTRAGKPAAFTGAVGETVGMYKTFMSVYMQNAFKAMGGVSKGDHGTAIRYIMATMGVSGLMGLPFVDDVDEAFTKHFGWSPIESFNKYTPKGIMTGLASVAPGWLGHPELNMDWSRKAGMPDILPRDLKSALGPVVGRTAPLISDALSGNAQDFLLDLLPNSVKGALGVYMGKDQGVVMGKNDRPTTRLTPGEEKLKVLGLPAARDIEEQRTVTRTYAKEQFRDSHLKDLAHKLIQGTASDAEEQRFRDLGGTKARLQNEQRAEQETIRERQLRHLPRILRRQESLAE